MSCKTGPYFFEQCDDKQLNKKDPVSEKFVIKSSAYISCDSIKKKDVPDIKIIILSEIFEIQRFDINLQRNIKFTIKIGSYSFEIDLKNKSGNLYNVNLLSTTKPTPAFGALKDFTNAFPFIYDYNHEDDYVKIDSNFTLDIQFFNSFYRIHITSYVSTIRPCSSSNFIIEYYEPLNGGFILNSKQSSLSTKIDFFKTKLLSNNIEVPEINIIGQTLIDGSDIGQVIFDIKDKYYYYDDIAKQNNGICKLEEIDSKNLVITNFDKPCVKITSIVIGTQESLRDKIGDIWNQSTDSFEEFFQDFLEYSMARYILSKILYGTFNINYLLRKNYKTFLSDLKKSRFCSFVKFFEQPNYSNSYKFFKYL